MVFLSGGIFRMGSDAHYPEEAPAHPVVVDGFWIDTFPVTNAAFARFVEDTGFVTQAELPPDPALYPGAKPELLVAGSLVFTQPQGLVSLDDPADWWRFVPGAQWRHPLGPGSGIEDRMDHPVVQVSHGDAAAYAAWAGKALPTEAEWEFAARGGLDGATYAWGESFAPGGRRMANTWQGTFPWRNDAGDGWERTSPVGAFPPNGYGLFDMIGNVWEWTDDWYRDSHRGASKTCCAPSNPRGGEEEQSFDPALPDIPIPRKVIKGGSHLCAPNYCQRYRPAARSPQAIDTSSSHLGFRCVRRG